MRSLIQHEIRDVRQQHRPQSCSPIPAVLSDREVREKLLPVELFSRKPPRGITTTTTSTRPLSAAPDLATLALLSTPPTRSTLLRRGRADVLLGPSPFNPTRARYLHNKTRASTFKATSLLDDTEIPLFSSFAIPTRSAPKALRNVPRAKSALRGGGPANMRADMLDTPLACQRVLYRLPGRGTNELYPVEVELEV